MKKIENLDSCTACTACYNICPVNCIHMVSNNEGFLYPQVENDKCINCNKCENICPELMPDERPEFKNAWYGWSKNEEIRKSSSSGGAFTDLSSIILDKGGVVYGTIFDYKNREAMYISTNNTTVDKMRKSKYVQSDMKNTINDIKKDLEKDRLVLYIGSSCHVAGVKKVLSNHKKYDKLILVDFICHGVPSPKILQEHLNYIENKKGKKIKNIDFRPKNDKIRPWSNHRLKIEFEDNDILNTNCQTDWYMQSFLKQSTILRKSCFNCRYSNQQHLGDITIADFWGINKYKPESNDEKGISLIIANTQKGKEYINKLQSKFNLYPLEWKYAKYVYKQHNYQNYYDLEKRNSFFELYTQQGYIVAMKKYAEKEIIKYKIKYPLIKTKSIIKKILSIN